MNRGVERCALIASLSPMTSSCTDSNLCIGLPYGDIPAVVNWCFRGTDNFAFTVGTAGVPAFFDSLESFFPMLVDKPRGSGVMA